MTFWTKTARCLALGALLIGAGLSATAQTITPGSGSATCQVSPTATGLTYTFSTSSGTLVNWITRGDLEITSANTANPVTVRSTGFGRGQIIARYAVGGCGPTPVIYEVNKIFTTTEPIVGPTCVLPNGTYTWSINPIISTAAQIAAQIGIDSYTWDIVAVSGTAPSLPAQTSGSASYSGDFSAIRLVMPPNVGTFKLRVKVGACNAFSPQTPEIIVTPTPSTPVITGPSCRPTSDVSPFTLTTTSQPGVVYTWNVPPTWTISPANATTGITATGDSLNVRVTPDANGGDVTVTASNGGNCGEAIGRYTLKRQLDPAVAQITNAPACFTIGTNVTLGVSPVANNSTFAWTIPAGFSGNNIAGPTTVVTPGPSIVVRATGPASGTISVTSNGCSGGVVSKVLRVNGNNGCTYALNDLGCGTIRVRSVSGTGCLPPTGTTYTWSAPGNSTVTTTANTYTFPNGLNNQQATVTISNTANCLSATVTGTFTSSPADCGGRAGGGRVTKGDLSIYPNPTGSKLNVDLPLKAGEQAKLTVLDMTGRILAQSTMKAARGSIDVSRLPEGVYMLHAKMPGGKVLSQKVIVRHESEAIGTDQR